MPENVDSFFLVKDGLVLNGLGAKWGELFPQAEGFPLYVAGAGWATAEHLYQACRFPTRPELQDAVRQAVSLKELQRVIEANSASSRADWEDVKVEFRRWAVRVKYAQHVRNIHYLFSLTENLPLVVCEPEDRYWGTTAISAQTLVGQNLLGQLLDDVRTEARDLPGGQFFQAVPPEVEGALLFGEPIATIVAKEPPAFTAFRPQQKAKRLKVDRQAIAELGGPNLLEQYQDKLPLALLIKNPVFRDGDWSNSAPYLIAGKVVDWADYPSDLDLPEPRRRRVPDWEDEDEDDDREFNFCRFDFSATYENLEAFGVDYCIVWLHADDMEGAENFLVDTWLAGNHDLESLFHEFEHLSRLVVGMKLDEEYVEPDGWDPSMWRRVCDKLRALPQGAPTKRQWAQWEDWDNEEAFQ